MTDPVLLLKLAGYFQIALCAGSLFIPHLLNWKEELKPVHKIIRQMFWVYAVYIFTFNLSFGLISVIGAEELVSKSFLARAITVFIFLYWLGRLMIQFFILDTGQAPKGFIYSAGKIGLTLMFIFLTAIYGWISYLNFQ